MKIFSNLHLFLLLQDHLLLAREGFDFAEDNRAGGTESGADRIALAQIALIDISRIGFILEHVSERTPGHAAQTPDASPVIYRDTPQVLVEKNRVGRASLRACGIDTLKAGFRHC